MSFLNERFLEYISKDELDIPTIERLIRIDPSLLMGRTLINLVERGFAPKNCGNLTFPALNALMNIDAFGDYLKIYQDMLDPTPEFIIDMIDQDMEYELILLVSHTDPEKIKNVFPEVMEERSEKILSFETFSIKSFNDETIKKFRLIMTNPPEILFKDYEVDIDEINLRKMTPTLEKLYLRYGKGSLILSESDEQSSDSDNESSDSEDSDEKWSLIGNVFSNDRGSDLCLNGNNIFCTKYSRYIKSVYSDRPPKPDMKFIKSIDFAFKGFNVQFTGRCATKFKSSMIAYSVYWDGTTVIPECLLNKIEEIGIDFLINGAIKNRIVHSFLGMIISQKRPFKFCIDAFEFLYRIYRDNALYLLDLYPSYKNLLKLSTNMRMMLVYNSLNRIDIFDFMNMDLSWIDNQIVYDLIEKNQIYKTIHVSNIVELAFHLINFALRSDDFVTAGFIISQDFPNRRTEIEDKVVKKIAKIFHFTNDENLVVCKDDKDISRENDFREGLLMGGDINEVLLKFCHRMV